MPAPQGTGALPRASGGVVPRPQVLLLGATSSILRAIAAELAGSGFDLLLAGRDAWELEALAADLRIRFGAEAETIELDVLDWPAARDRLERCLTGAGPSLHGAIVGIGSLGTQATAVADPEEARRVLEVNFTGPALLLGVLANHFEVRGSGFLCALGSVAGDRGRQSNYVYGSAKAGLAAFLQGLRNRLHPAGVRVITIKPGFVDTSMTFGLEGLFLVADPRSVARAVVRAVTRGGNEVYVPGFWRWVMTVIRLIPEWVFKRLRL